MPDFCIMWNFEVLDKIAKQLQVFDFVKYDKLIDDSLLVLAQSVVCVFIPNCVGK